MRSHIGASIVAVALLVTAIEAAAASDAGVDIVRMPRSPSTQPAATAKPGQPANETVKQGRLLKLTVKVGSQTNDSQRGWLGVRMDPLEAPLAASLGLDNAGGALVLDTIAGGPLAQSGVRFGDIIVALNGKAITGVSDLQRRVGSISPGGGAVLDVWRASPDEADFLQTLRRLGYGGDSHAMFLLGRIYATGSGVLRNDGEAVQWYRRARRPATSAP